MSMGAKSGLGRGLAHAGQQILNTALDTRRLNFEQQKLDRNMTYKNGTCVDVRWKLGIGDADTAGVAGGMTKPTRAVTIPAGETVTPAAIPTDRAPAVGPFRLPAMNGRIRPRMSSPTAPMGGANMLGRRPDDEDVYG